MDARRLISAVASPLTAAIAAAGGATWFVSGLWWILPVTAGAMAVVSATQYKSPEPEGLQGEYAARERAIVAQVARIEGVLAEGSGAVKSSLSEVPRQLQDLRDKVRRLLDRQARIDAFVGEVPAQKARAELQQLQNAHDAARTDDARTKFANALQNRRAELESRAGLHEQSERIAAELAEIESALGSTLSKIVALQDLQGEARRAGGEGISNSLGDVLDTVDALEEALAEAFDPARSQGRRKGPDGRGRVERP